MSLHRTKARNPPTINEFAISREGEDSHASEINHGYHLNMRFIETRPIPNKPVPASGKMHPLC